MSTKTDKQIAPDFLFRHFKMLINQAILALGKRTVQKIVDDAEIGG